MRYEELLIDLGIDDKSPNKNGWISPIRCPFPDHDDNGPSFGINAETGGWRCHSRCGHGNIYRFVSKMKGVTLDEATNFVRSRVGSTATYEKPALSVDALREKLENSRKAITENKTEEAFVEYSLDKKNLVKDRWPNWWEERGFDYDDWISWDVWYDSRSGDAVFPFRDYKGRMVGEIRRRFPGSWEAEHFGKYKNNDDLPRNDVLFGEYRAASEKHIFLCEGPLDAIWLWHCGIPAVALCGSYLADGQRKRLMVDMDIEELTLIFDADDAGRKAALSVLQYGINADVVKLPPGKDPNNIQDPNELREIINSPRVSLLKFALGGKES